jgi:ketopantoate reductase
MHRRANLSLVVSLTEKGSTLTSSMCRDLQKGDPVEAEQTFGDLVAHA